MSDKTRPIWQQANNPSWQPWAWQDAFWWLVGYGFLIMGIITSIVGVAAVIWSVL